jgi:Domain of unknown function (DUF2024)
MEVAVWDTYVTKKDGNALHFDIIVPNSLKDKAIIYQFGKDYLVSKNEGNSPLDTDECQFCHIEEPTAEMMDSIKNKGYFILEMDEIPATLPPVPTRRELILHLRAFYKMHRFADFKGKNVADLQLLLNK